MRTAVSRLCSMILATALVLSGKPHALALDGYYIGQWATDKEACEAKASPNKVILQQTDLLTPQLHCKLMGVRQDNRSGATFMAHCSDMTNKWNDEITIRANSIRLSLSLKSDGQQRQFVRCSPDLGETKKEKSITPSF